LLPVKLNFLPNCFSPAFVLQEKYAFMKQFAAYLFILLSFSITSTAQLLDSSFAVNGYTQDNNFLATINSIALQPDGKIVAALDCSMSQPNSLDLFACRYKANGTLDSAFGTNGISHAFAGAKSVSKDVVLQPDGKIIVAGHATYCNQIVCGFDNFVMERLLANGQPDSSFGQYGFVKCGPVFGAMVMGGAATRLKVLSSGKILAAGTVIYQATGGGMEWYVFVIRFNSNGSIDNTFGNNGIMQTGMGVTDMFATLADMVIDNNGNIYCTGRKSYTGTNLPNPADGFVFKINASGTLDNSFGTNGVVLLNKAPWDDPVAIALRTDGKILIAGTTKPTWSASDPGTGAIYMLETNGTPASLMPQGYRSFTIPGKTSALIQAITMHAGNKFSIAGYADSSNHTDAFVTRFNADGTGDNSFNNNTNYALYSISTSGSMFFTIKEMTNGQLLVAGRRNFIASGLKQAALLARLKAPSANGIGTVVQQADIVSVYPNPAQGHIYISCQAGNAGAQVQVRAADISGKTVYRYSGTLQQLETDMNRWFSGCSNGVYLLQLSDDDGNNQSLKLVKE